MKWFRRILEKHLVDIWKENDFDSKIRLKFHFSFHLLDVKNFFKFSNINWKICFDERMTNTLMFDYWTPRWHEERGAYINICLFGLRFMRGY